MLSEYIQLESIIAMIFSFIGCSIRYGELYKTNNFKGSWYFIDSFISIFLGYITYLEAVNEFSISITHTYLICIIIGNIGSKVLTFVKFYIYNKIKKIDNLDIKDLNKIYHDDVDVDDTEENKNADYSDDSNDKPTKEQ